MTFLGTGSAFSKKYGNNSALVTVSNNQVTKNMLIDCGRTTPDDLYSVGYHWSNIDAIFITHLHGDHVYGLEEAGFMGRFVLKKKPHLIFPHKKLKSDLWDKVLKGTMVNGDLSRNMVFDDYFTYEIVHDVEQYFIFNGTMFSVFSTQHINNKKSYGLIIGEYNYIMYSADSLFDKDLLNIVVDDGAQAIFHDCQLFDHKGKVHASLDELETLERDVREKTYIMHYGDTLEDEYIRIKDSGLNIAVKGTTYSYDVI